MLVPVAAAALWTGEVTALAGAALGVLLAGWFPDAWTLLFARAAGARLTGVQYGRGRSLFSGAVGGVPIEVGLVPTGDLQISFSLVPVPGLRWRLWLNSAALLAVQLGLGGLLAAGPNWFTRSLGIALLTTTVVRNLGYQFGPMAPLWAALGLSLRPGLLPHTRRPEVLRADRMLALGRVGAARRQLDLLPSPRPVSATEVGVLLAEGRFEEADSVAVQLIESDDRCCHLIAYQLLACSAVAAGEAGTRESEEVRRRVTLALVAFSGGTDPDMPYLERHVQLAADAALLNGRPEEAGRLAAHWSTRAGSRYWRADAACTLAAARWALGDHDGARAALDRARAQCPELARIGPLEVRLRAAAGGATGHEMPQASSVITPSAIHPPT
ncbi:hypothetical protein [Kitasatospora sp. NPDC002965]|uniref:hypothetical protein n=1 Tax=Kitasatospora sp. NPDC002965 TaxID=3154775 RepID=UPI0033A4D6C0